MRGLVSLARAVLSSWHMTKFMWKHRSNPSTNKVRYDAFLAAHPGLRNALMHNHRISMDLDAKLMQFHTLSDAQINLAFKIYGEAYGPARPSETNVAAPTGRQTIRGTVVSVKDHESQFGITLKMTVKVTTDAGTWLCWGTVPSNLTTTSARIFQSDPVAGPSTRIEKGTEVEFTATLVSGREPHFAFFKRPTNARVIETTADQAVAA